MRIYYCPKCGEFKIQKNNEVNLHKNDVTIKNMLDWQLPPVQHYKCKCGNYLAGYFEFVTEKDLGNKSETDETYDSFKKLTIIQQNENMLFYKNIIEDFNEGGLFYNRKIHGVNQDFENYKEFAKFCYEDRLKNQSNGTFDEEEMFNTDRAITQMLS